MNRKKKLPEEKSQVFDQTEPDEVSMREAPVGHIRDFRSGASWRIFRIMSEFVEGFEFLADLKKEVSFFGSARTKPSDHYYKEARKLAKMLGGAGFSIITGGGPGIMEAANQGAVDAGAPSIGLNIQLPREQRTNPYVRKSVGFHYFFTRKVMLSISSQAYAFFPGGFGTIDELFEMLTLVQTKKSPVIPIVLVGKEYWDGLFAWVKHEMIDDHETIDKGDLDIFHVVDTAEEAFELIKNTMERDFI